MTHRRMSNVPLDTLQVISGMILQVQTTDQRQYTQGRQLVVEIRL